MAMGLFVLARRCVIDHPRHRVGYNARRPLLPWRGDLDLMRRIPWMLLAALLASCAGSSLADAPTSPTADRPFVPAQGGRPPAVDSPTAMVAADRSATARHTNYLADASTDGRGGRYADIDAAQPAAICHTNRFADCPAGRFADSGARWASPGEAARRAARPAGSGRRVAIRLPRRPRPGCRVESLYDRCDDRPRRAHDRRTSAA